MRCRKVISILAWLACAAGAGGQVRYVSHWGSHEAPFDSWETAATNLVDAVHATPDGGTVQVDSGVYRTGADATGGMDARLSLTRPINVRSVGGYSNTVIEGLFHAPATPVGTSAVRTVYMTNGVLDGFTLRRGATRQTGTTAQISGGGLYAGGGTQLNLRVVSNYGQTAGGAWLHATYVSNVIFALNQSVTGPRVKIDGRVRMEHVRLNPQGPHFPDARILGTNGAVIVNGDPATSAENGTDSGRVIVVSGMQEHTLTVTNSGTRPLMIGGWSVLGPHAAEFVVVPPATDTLAAGEATTFEVQFLPTVIGLRRALIFMASNDPDDDPYAVWVEGEGYAADMRVFGTNLNEIVNGETVPNLADGTDFGVCVDEPIRRRFLITNVGNGPLTFTNEPHIAMSGEHPQDFTVVTQPDTVVEPGDSTFFEIEFSPWAVETRTAEVQLFSDDLYHTNSVYQFRVRGEVATNNLFFALDSGVRDLGASAMAWGDYDQDGWLDMAVIGFDGTNRYSAVYRNLGDGTFTNIHAGITALEYGAVAWGDYNNDGYLDLAVMGRSDTTPAVTEIYRNNGDGTFTRASASFTGLYNGSLAWGDYDNDGDLDLIVSGFTLTENRTILYRNNGDETFTAISTSIPGMRAGRVVWADYNNDGRLDVLIIGTDGSTRYTRLYENTESGFVQRALTGVPPVAYGGVSFGDFNADGRLDFALTGNAQTSLVSRVFTATGGSPLYTAVASELTPVWLGDCVLTDWNNDGQLDLVYAGADSNNVDHVKLYEQDAGALMPLELEQEIPGMRITSMAWGDVDNDGDVDMAISGETAEGSRTHIYRNLSATTNAPPTAPAGLTATRVNGNQVIFSWDAATDAETPDQSLTYNLYVGTAGDPIRFMAPQADLATGQRHLPALGNVQLNREWKIENLPAGDIVWGVQAVDATFAGGPFVAGPTVTIPELPDVIVESIDIQEVPFAVSITIRNQGAVATTAPVTLSAWLDRSATADCSTIADLTNSVAPLSAGDASTIVFDGLTRNAAPSVNTFRAFVNSECTRTVFETRYDNNQMAQVYTNNVYEPFWFNAVALTDNVYLRWLDPTEIGWESSDVLIRYSTTAYPAATSDGQPLPGPVTGQMYHHTGLTPHQPYFYTIWLTNDGIEWHVP
jgi:hypothetical protein